MRLEETLANIISIAVPIVEVCGAVVIVLGVGRTLVMYLRNFFKRDCTAGMRALRVRLGQNLVMGLEFQVAADILKTSVSPTWEDILFLAALIGLRTVLNFLLEYEMRVIATQKALQEPVPIPQAPSTDDPA
jgi:uncharacterized membrane protein